MDLTWQDAEEIGIRLAEAHPGVEPLTVSPGPAVHASVSEGPRQRSNEQNSEAGE